MSTVADPFPLASVVNGTRHPRPAAPKALDGNYLQLDTLVINHDRSHLFPIEFCYDYMPKDGHRPTISTIEFDNPFHNEIQKNRGANSIALYPWLTKLPWFSGLRTLRQNKHWATNLRCTTELLHLFAEDSSLDNPDNANGLALADFANRELQTRSYDRYSRFTTYMFPEASEARTALLAQIILFIVIFDDTWEETDGDNIKRVQDDFIQRIQGNVPLVMSDTPLQKRISEVHQGFLQEDATIGNGGIDVINALIDFCRHPQPKTKFSGVREYLDYRYKDVAMPYSYSCLKFSLQSSVDLKAPKLQRYLQLVGDHFSIANDIASYQKEYDNWAHGKAKHLINVVAVVQNLLDLKSSDDAKAVCYAIQLQTEQAILGELERMKQANELSRSEWDYVDAALAMAAGNVFTSVVISQYGGEAARIGNSLGKE